MARSLRVGFWNLNGYNSRTLGNKLKTKESLKAVVQVCLRTIVMQMRLVAIQSLLNFGVMTVYSGHPKGNICN